MILVLEEMNGSQIIIIKKNQVLSGAWKYIAPQRCSWALRAGAGTSCDGVTVLVFRLRRRSIWVDWHPTLRLCLGDVGYCLNGQLWRLLSHCGLFLGASVLTAPGSVSNAPLAA